MSTKDFSTEVSFISVPAGDAAPESFLSETSALESPERVGLMRRAVELCDAGVVTGREIGDARRSGTIEELVLGKSNWIVGGDYNAPLASEDFEAMISGGMTPLSAEDEQGGAFSYVKGPKSLIDHVFLSANLAQVYGSDDFFIVAKDKTVPGYVANISDHRPVLVRLSLNPASHEAKERPSLPPSLLEALRSAGAVSYR
jgi:hypothetical protein